MAVLKYFDVRGNNDRKSKELSKYIKNVVPARNTYMIPMLYCNNEAEIIYLDKKYNNIMYKIGFPFLLCLKIMLLPLFLIGMFVSALIDGVTYVFGIHSYNEIVFNEDLNKWGIENLDLKQPVKLKRKQGYSFKIYILFVTVFAAAIFIAAIIKGIKFNFLLILIEIITMSIINPIIFNFLKISLKNVFTPDGKSVAKKIKNNDTDTVIPFAIVENECYLKKMLMSKISGFIFDISYGRTNCEASEKNKKYEKNSFKDLSKTDIKDLQLPKTGYHSSQGYFFTDTALYDINKDLFTEPED